MAKYAEGTEVAPDRSRAQIERKLQQAGATAYSYGWKDNQVVIQFVLRKRKYQIPLTLPDLADYRYTDTGRERSPGSQQEAYAAECRRRWRVLLLWVTAALELAGDEDFPMEEVFQAYMVVPAGDGREMRVGPHVAEQVGRMYDLRTPLPLLPELPALGAGPHP